MFLTNVQEARYYVLMTIKSFYNEIKTHAFVKMHVNL